MTVDFRPFSKIARLSREVIITEKIDGTNASIYIDTATDTFLTGSRTRWITPTDDNFGFSRWAHEHKEELMQLGDGHHFGEWWGQKIQRGYGLTERRFSLFNVSRWRSANQVLTMEGAVLAPECCSVVPILAKSATFDLEVILTAMKLLKSDGSQAAPNFMNPEGIVVYHTAGGVFFKKTFENDEAGKGERR